MRVLTWDLEWLPGSLDITVAGLFDGKQYRAFQNIRSFLEHVLSRRYKGAYLFAHFGGRFDDVFLLQGLRRYFPLLPIGIIMNGSSAVMIEVHCGGYSVRFCDSQFLFKQSLDDMGESLGMPKGDCPFNAPYPLLRAYNEQDCRILWHALDRAALALASLGSTLSFTLASTSLRLFRVRYLSEDIPTSSVHNAEIRPGYVASRVEDYRRLSPRGRHYDINSSFPNSQMRPLPGRHLTTDRNIGDMTIAHVRVRVPDMWLPPLPIRHGGSIYFPTGEFDGWYSNDDLALLEEMGGEIVSVYKAHHYEPWDDISRFVTDIYNLRLKSADDPFLSGFWKIVMNAGVYGKLGERGDKERIVFGLKRLECPHDGEHERDTPGRPTCIRRVAAGIWAVLEPGDPPHTHIPVPLITTARSRADITRFGSRAEGLAYVDTDGLASRSTFESSTRLGELKHEYDYIDGHFPRCKMYALTRTTPIKERELVKMRKWLARREITDVIPEEEVRHVVKAKGFPRLLRREFDYLTGVGAHGAGSISVRQFDSLRKTMIRDGHHPSEGMITKGLYRVCGTCDIPTGGEPCRDHPNSIQLPAHGSRPKRMALGDYDSRPWNYDELEEPWKPEGIQLGRSGPL